MRKNARSYYYGQVIKIWKWKYGKMGAFSINVYQFDYLYI